jgi:hypothetical protein
LSSLADFYNKIKKIRAFALPLYLILFFALPCQASNPLDVVINEIAWMGSEVQGIEQKNWWRYEWLELYNNTPLPIQLDGWKLELYRTGLDWSLALKGTVPADGYFLVVSSNKIFSNFDQNYSSLSGKFVNGGQRALLKDSSGAVVDELDCTNGWFAGDNSKKLTMERVSPLLPGNDKNNWLDSKNTNGTPGLKNDEKEAAGNLTETIGKTTNIFQEEKTSENQQPSNKTSEIQAKTIEKNGFSPFTLLIAGVLAVLCAVFIFIIKKLQQNKNLL